MKNRWHRPAGDGETEREEQTVTESGDRSFDWVAALALLSGAAVLIPSFVAFAATLLAIAVALL